MYDIVEVGMAILGYLFFLFFIAHFQLLTRIQRKRWTKTLNQHVNGLKNTFNDVLFNMCAPL